MISRFIDAFLRLNSMIGVKTISCLEIVVLCCRSRRHRFASFLKISKTPNNADSKYHLRLLTNQILEVASYYGGSASSEAPTPTKKKGAQPLSISRIQSVGFPPPLLPQIQLTNHSGAELVGSRRLLSSRATSPARAF